MSFSIKQLRYFVASAEIGQISLAAKELFISQSAITTAIQEVESQLGQELLIRSTKGVVLTDLGRLFLPRARQILALVDEASRTSLQGQNTSGAVTIGVSYTVMGYFLPYHIQRLSSLYPQIKLNLVEDNRSAIEEKLLKKELDFGLLLTSNIQNPELQTETFFRSLRRLWVASNHPFLLQNEICLSDIANQPYIMLDVDEADKVAMRYWKNSISQPQIYLQTSSVEAVRSMVANGSGVAILSDMVYRPWSLEGKRIETIVLSDPIPSMDIGLVWQKNSDFSPTMSAVYNYFHDLFRVSGNFQQRHV